MLGVGLWYVVKAGCQRGRSSSREGKGGVSRGRERLKKVRSSDGLLSENNEFLTDYYYK